jgi:hypothetical protein
MWDSGHTRKGHKTRPSASESCRNGDVPALTLSAINRCDPYSDGTIRDGRIAPSFRKILAQSHGAPGGHVTDLWRRTLRRSQNDGFTRKRMTKLVADLLPPPRILPGRRIADVAQTD